LAEVYLGCYLTATVTKNALIMTVFAAVAALATATCLGYYFGRRAGSAPPSWKKRTSRVALGRRAVNLLALVAARRLGQRFPVQRVELLLGPRVIAPLELLRGSVARMRSYRNAPGW